MAQAGGLIFPNLLNLFRIRETELKVDGTTSSLAKKDAAAAEVGRRAAAVPGTIAAKLDRLARRRTLR